MLEPMYQVKEVAAMLHVGESRIRDLLNKGELEHVHLSPRKRLIPEQSVNRFLEKRTLRKPERELAKQPQNHVHQCRNRSLTTENDDEMDVKSIRGEISRLCQ